MPLYAALIYEAPTEWGALTEAAQQEVLEDYDAFGRAARDIIRGGEALYPVSAATTVQVRGGKGGQIVTSDGPFAETTEVLSGFYLLECADLDEAVAWAAQIPGAWTDKVEVRPVIELGGA